MDQLKEHFIELGYRFDWGKPRIHKELRRLMGREQHEYLLDQLDLVGTGLQVVSPYAIPRTYKEAALLFSFDGIVAPATSAKMLEVLKPYLVSGMKVADMGCGIGALVSWMALRYSDIYFQGIDAAENLISAASSRFKYPNLNFSIANYTSLLPHPEEFDLIFSIFGLECGFGESPRFGIDLHTMRGSPGYQKVAGEALPVLVSWRESVKLGSKLFILIRASGPERMLPVLDVAAKSGWKWNMKDSQAAFIFENGDKNPPSQTMPLLAFDAVAGEGASGVVDIMEAFSWYSFNTYHPLDRRKEYKADNPHVLAEQIMERAKVEWQTQQDYDDGHTAQAMILKEGELVHLLRRATTGYCWLDTKHYLNDVKAIEQFRKNPL
jgi:hypothetical protein